MVVVASAVLVVASAVFVVAATVIVVAGCVVVVASVSTAAVVAAVGGGCLSDCLPAAARCRDQYECQPECYPPHKPPSAQFREP